VIDIACDAIKMVLLKTPVVMAGAPQELSAE